jgi:hypothetical protein
VGLACRGALTLALSGPDPALAIVHAGADAGPRSAETEAYVKSIVDFLKSQPGKKCTMSALGSKVAKPQGLPKLSILFKNHEDIFTADFKANTVTLK